VLHGVSDGHCFTFTLHKYHYNKVVAVYNEYKWVNYYTFYALNV